jgi:hypothetical protein
LNSAGSSRSAADRSDRTAIDESGAGSGGIGGSIFIGTAAQNDHRAQRHGEKEGFFHDFFVSLLKTSGEARFTASYLDPTEKQARSRRTMESSSPVLGAFLPNEVISTPSGPDENV